MSRGAFLAVFVFYFYIYILKGNNFFLKMIIILVSVYSIFMIFISNSPVFLFIRNIILRPESGTTGRSDIWKIGIDVLKDNNFVNGLGLNTGIEFGKSRGLVLEQFHSFYIEVLLSGGFVELIFIAIIITSVFVNCKKLNKKTRYIVQGRILGFLSLGFFESVSLFSIGYVDILFSIMIIALPLLMVNSQKNFEEGELY
jgi:O-antigen ligase